MCFQSQKECVIIIKRKRKGRSILTSFVPYSLKDEPKNLDLAKNFKSNLIDSLNYIEKHPRFNYISVFIPNSVIFYDDYLKTVFSDLVSTYGKKLIKRKLKLFIKDDELHKKINAIIFDKYQKFQKKEYKKIKKLRKKEGK